MKNHLANERGISLIAMALWMTAFFAIVAVGVDVGRIAFTASEMQSAADTAALTGARALIDAGTKAAATTAANAVLGNLAGGGTVPNTVDGMSAYTAASSIDIKVGTVNGTGAFTEAAENVSNAVQATITATVTNIFAGVFGGSNGSTTVTKLAKAVFATTDEGAPGLPLVLAGGCFDAANCTAGSCPSLDTHTNVGWTGFVPSGHAKPDIDPFIPGCGGGATADVLNVGDSIDTTNGVVNAIYQDLHCWVCEQAQKHYGPYLLAVVDKTCDVNFTGAFSIKGFATVTINAAYCDPGYDITNVPIDSIRATGRPGGIGNCPNCGTGFIRLIG